jgi:hypothetical protein
MPYGWANVDNVQANAARLYYGGSGKPYKGPTQAPINKYTTQALDQTRGLAGQDVPGLAQATAFNTGMIQNNGLTPELQGVAGNLNPMAQSETGLTSGQDEAAGYLRGFAQGDYYDDPDFNRMLDRNAERAGTIAKTTYGGGHFGGAAFGAGLGQSISDANLNAIVGNHQFSRGQQLSASGQLGGLYSTGANQKLAANGALSDIYGQGLGRAFQAQANLPALNELRYDGAARLAGVGDYYQNYNQQKLAGQIDQKNQQSMEPWANLNRFSDVMTGTGKLGGYTFGKTAGPSQMQSTLGGALAGAGMGAKVGSAVPGIGTGVGAGAGALLGGLGGYFQ